MSQSLAVRFFLIFLLIGCALAYWPGLGGDYVFDDSGNILGNAKIAMVALDRASLIAAFWSGDAGPLGRPISMLSFALNHYFTGFDPFYFKLTNLVIHLVNVLLVYALAKLLLAELMISSTGGASRRFRWAALAVAAVWALHPIQLTSVLYVVQRMTSLSTLFGLLALVIYIAWRSSIDKKKPLFAAIMTVGVISALSASIFSKESGVLFIPLIVWIELLIFKGQVQGRAFFIGRFTLQQLIWFGVGVLTILALCIILPRYVNPAFFARRDFSLEERLFTEARVMFYYLRLIITPSLSELSLYHDDFRISKGLLDPITTLASIAALIALTFACLLRWRWSAVWLFAWGWFLISHALESTIISLELVHEHRNYFALFGPAFLIGYGLVCASGRFLKIYTIFILCLIVGLAFLTWQRSLIWSNLVDHAAFEASSHPESERANYQMARIHMRLMQQEAPELNASRATQALDAAASSYLPGNGAWFGRIHLAYFLNQEPDHRVVVELEQRLRELPFYNNNVGFLSAFTRCQIARHCKLPHHQVVKLLVAALENPSATPHLQAEMYKLLAQYFIETGADFAKGEEFLHDALALNNDVNARLLLTQTLRLKGDISAAREQLHQARMLDVKGAWLNEILIEERNLSEHSEQSAKQ